jgi:hypothetical protein
MTVLAHEFCFVPQHWERVTGIRIIDNDGWRGRDFVHWDTPITREDFVQRAAISTAEYPRGFPQRLLDGPL